LQRRRAASPSHSAALSAGVGIDVDPSKVDAINQGRSYISDIPSDRLTPLTINHYPFTINHSPASALTATTDYSILSHCDVVIICVPTPLNKTRDPDVRFLIAAGESVARYIHPGMLVVLESTTYPGTTEELLLPMLEAGIRGQRSEVRGQRSEDGGAEGERAEVGVDFFLAFSPERIDPGRTDWTVENTPKVVGGVTPACLEVATALYQQAVDRVVPVSSPAAAEMTKLLENTFRAVNIALVNEVAIMCDKLGINVWEVVDAAATKPYGFMKFTPGPGVGGQCAASSSAGLHPAGSALPVVEAEDAPIERLWYWLQCPLHPVGRRYQQ